MGKRQAKETIRKLGLHPARQARAPVPTDFAQRAAVIFLLPGKARPEVQIDQRGFLLSFCATRVFTIFLINGIGSGLSCGKWMVHLEVEKSLSSLFYASITEAVGNKLQWFEKAANQTSMPLCLKAGMR